MADNCRAATHLLLRSGKAKRITFNLNLFLKEYLLSCGVLVAHIRLLCWAFRNGQQKGE